MLVPTTRDTGPIAISAASTYYSPTMENFAGIFYLTILIVLTVAGGGTTCVVFLQTSLDQGGTWMDIAAFNFTTATASKVKNLNKSTAQTASLTPGDGALGSDVSVNGPMGDRFRLKIVTTGTYTGNSYVRGFLNPS